MVQHYAYQLSRNVTYATAITTVEYTMTAHNIVHLTRYC